MTNLLKSAQIAELVRRIGSREIVAVLSGSNDPAEVDAWLNGEAAPNQQQAGRIAFVQEWSVKIMSDQSFKMWLGAQVQLPDCPGTISTADAIGRDLTHLVVGAIKRIYDIQY